MDGGRLGIALRSQQEENQTLSIVGTLLWLLLGSFICSEFILNQI